MNSSINTDFVRSNDGPYPFLKQIAEAGFRHIHWCHHWCDDFVYHASEIAQIGRWVGELGLGVADLHASSGCEKYWVSPLESARLAGVELVLNRIEMAAALGARAIVLHLPGQATAGQSHGDCLDSFRRTFDALAPHLQKHRVRLALENLFGPPPNEALLDKVLAQYPQDLVGICYDSGHGLITGDGLAFLERHRDRLAILHLHDNQGQDDLHLLPFSGRVDWNRLAASIAASPYDGPITLELTMDNQCGGDIPSFLREAKTRCERLVGQISLAQQTGGSF
ncbi:MAG: sugar phosphate isomerase/epimerase [Lentisphaerae bacterium]|nr:sugar phosphate isomerase/epimerase [Lentisphaerota bacterium]